MHLREFLSTPHESAQRTGPGAKIVMSSRVRLARNISGFAFPGWAKKPDRQRACDVLVQAVGKQPEMQGGFSAALESLAALDKQLLVERHLISREHAAKGAGSAMVLSRDESLCVMINEEDHLRMQSLLPGFQLQETWQAVDHLDTALEQVLDYVFSRDLGYLTACPTNLGTGIRVSAMVHLPALVLDEQVTQIIQAVNKLGLAVRGLYGEGTEALGNVFQISNQMTLGEPEAEIVERLSKVVAQVIEHEENARARMLEGKSKVVYNHVGRAYGILANAHSLSSKEAINLLSLLRLGIDLDCLPGVPRALVDELAMITQPAHLQSRHSEKLSAEERDVLRADMLREALRDVRRPVMPPPAKPLDNPPAA